jgi:hypothetical protein
VSIELDDDGSAMRPSVVVLIAVVALMIGIGIGLALAPTTGRSIPSVDAHAPLSIPSASADELARWKDEILSEVRRLRDVPPSTEAPASQRATIVAPQEAIDRRLSQIEQRLDAMASNTPTYQRTQAWRNARGPGSPSIDAVTNALRDADQHGRLAEAREELARRFYLWTPDEVVAAIGPPKSVGAQHGVDFGYGTFDLKDGTCALWFSFQAGLISEVWFECNDRK